MEIGLITLAIILATLLGWLLKQSFNTQPWVAEQSAIRHITGRSVTSNTKLIALTDFAGGRDVILCADSECLCTAHGARRLGADDRAAAAVDEYRDADRRECRVPVDAQCGGERAGVV